MLMHTWVDPQWGRLSIGLRLQFLFHLLVSALIPSQVPKGQVSYYSFQ